EREIAEIIGARHAVIHERAAEELTARVVDDVLAQRLAEALDDAALDLAFADQRIEHGTDIVDGGIPRHPELACLAIDLDLASIPTSQIWAREGKVEAFAGP